MVKKPNFCCVSFCFIHLMQKSAEWWHGHYHIWVELEFNHYLQPNVLFFEYSNTLLSFISCQVLLWVFWGFLMNFLFIGFSSKMLKYIYNRKVIYDLPIGKCKSKHICALFYMKWWMSSGGWSHWYGWNHRKQVYFGGFNERMLQESRVVSLQNC